MVVLRKACGLGGLCVTTARAVVYEHCKRSYPTVVLLPSSTTQWLHNYGLGIHLIGGGPKKEPVPINPRSEHMSFQADCSIPEVCVFSWGLCTIHFPCTRERNGKQECVPAYSTPALCYLPKTPAYVRSGCWLAKQAPVLTANRLLFSVCFVPLLLF